MATTSSESLDALFAALSKAQGAFGHAPKRAENPYFHSRYAELADVLDTIREPLAANGLAVVQMPGWEGELVTLTTRLGHASGQWIESTAAARPVKNDPQGLGSCLTYLRRYTLAAVLGIAQADDDGNAASEQAIAEKPKPKQSEPKRKEPAQGSPLDDYRDVIGQITSVAAINERVAKLPEVEESIRGAVGKLIAARAKQLGYVYVGRKGEGEYQIPSEAGE